MIGKSLSHFRILARIGEGGMGVVYRAEDTKLRRQVALKILPPELTGNEERRRWFLREARAAAAISHPNIATVHEVGEEGETVFIAMELVEGRTLREVIGGRPMPVKEALRVAVQMAEGLARAHGKGVIHRDLKPENVMVGADGRPKLLDFGLAKLLEDQLTAESQDRSRLETISAEVTREGKLFGTPAYMSPEQVEGKPADARSDVFAFGTILYEMLSGQRAFKGDSPSAIFTAILRDAPVPLQAIRADVPSDLERIVRRSVEKQPGFRYPSGEELWRDLAACQARLAAAEVGLRALLRRPRAVAAAAVLVLALVGAAAWIAVRTSRARWVREEAVPEIARLIEKHKYVAAFLLAREAERYLPDDPDIRRAISSTSVPTSIGTTPPGADLYFKEYLSVDAAWIPLGRAPLEDVRIPWVSMLRWRVEKEGFDALEAALRALPEAEIHFTLEPEGTAPPGMARVPAGEFQQPGGSAVTLEEYWIDRDEVTNREFGEFVASGGYRKREYWKVPFAREGRPVPWEQAMAGFRDTTGRPAPATWRLETFPEGEADFPVRGVSWYEAAAYCDFAGKGLPTVYHWYRAADLGASSDIILLSNFGGKGPAPVGSHPGLGRYGTYDMAGNVKEWCWNETGTRRYILGGAWSEPDYMYADEDAHAPFDRSETFGVRCAKYGAPVPEALKAPIQTLLFDYSKEKPAGDEAFRLYRGLYAYDRGLLNARVESLDEGAAHWRRETVSFDAAYGNERVVVHLYLPKDSEPPFQTVIYFPGSFALEMKSSVPDPQMRFTDFIPRSGRALVCPVYKGTYERRAPSPPSWPYGWRDMVIQWGKDLGRAIDYLETRPDIDSKRLAFYGLSMGAAYGPLLCALEERLEASILLGGGFHPEDMSGPPEVNPFHFAPRARTPTLMINGRQDFIFPLGTVQLPLFRLLGAQEKDKRHALYEGGHIPQMETVIKETLEWLDRYLGPVDRQN